MGKYNNYRELLNINNILDKKKNDCMTEKLPGVRARNRALIA